MNDSRDDLEAQLRQELALLRAPDDQALVHRMIDRASREGDATVSDVLIRDHDDPSTRLVGTHTRRIALVTAAVLAVAAVAVVAALAGSGQHSRSRPAADATSSAYAYIDVSSGCTPNALGSPHRLWYTSDGARAIPNPSGGAPTIVGLPLGTAKLSDAQISNLPTDPKQLIQSLVQLVHPGQDGTQQLPPDGQVFNMIEALVVQPANEALRLAAVSAASAMAGVMTTPNATDQFGNTGTSLNWADTNGESLQVLINPSSGMAESSDDVVNLGEGAPSFECTTRILDTGTADRITDS